MRRVPPVAAPLKLGSLGAGLRAALGSSGLEKELAERITATHNAASVRLFDSGTSALVAAFRRVAGDRKVTIACPAYVCVDVGAAAAAAPVKLALYDTDPHSLSPDIDSLRRVVASGADAILVAHMYGYPVDLDAVIAVAREHGVPLIEDAAQEAGATYRGLRLGMFGDIGVLSFGRGKGRAGGGGALLVKDSRSGNNSAKDVSAVNSHGTLSASAGWRDLMITAAQWAFGRPALYGIPQSIPWLRLGEMTYRYPSLIRTMSRASMAMALAGWNSVSESAEIRKVNAARIAKMAVISSIAETIHAVRGADATFLRYPLLFPSRADRVVRRIGAVPGYPRLLSEEPALKDIVTSFDEQLIGAVELRDRLVTLPTHHQLTDRDFVSVRQLLETELA